MKLTEEKLISFINENADQFGKVKSVIYCDMLNETIDNLAETA